MNRTVLLLILVVAVGVAVAAGAWYLGFRPAQNVPLIVSGEQVSPVQIPASSASPVPIDQSPVALTVEEWVTGLEVPWSLVFTSPTRMIFTERPGQVRVVENGQLLEQPLAVFPETFTQAEDGLLGLAIDPEYAANKYVYLSLTYQKNGKEVLKIVRMKDEGDQLTGSEIILDDIPAARVHSGNRLKFGPDRKLYISTGDAAQRELAQDRNSLAGKILRINADGSIPGDNPFPGSAIYSLGHRNPQGIDWHPVTGNLYETEHGPSGFDGPGGGDEVNLIKAGQNYGWPLVSHQENRSGLMAPLLTYTPAVAPASGMFYRSARMPQLTNTFLFGGLRGEGIYQVVFSPTDPEKIERHGKLAEVTVGRVRDLVEGPDGAIYFSSSNQDGRGNPRPGDDKIYRLVPR